MPYLPSLTSLLRIAARYNLTSIHFASLLLECSILTIPSRCSIAAGDDYRCGSLTETVVVGCQRPVPIRLYASGERKASREHVRAAGRPHSRGARRAVDPELDDFCGQPSRSYCACSCYSGQVFSFDGRSVRRRPAVTSS